MMTSRKVYAEKVRVLARLGHLNSRARDLRAEVASVESERDRLRSRLDELRQLEELEVEAERTEIGR